MTEDKFFIDSNILLYVFGNDVGKKDLAKSLLRETSVISTQVVNENVSVCLRKLKLSQHDAFAHGQNLLQSCTVVSLNAFTLLAAFKYCTKYNFSFWDSLIVAAALENNCTVLLSEDMQHDVMIEGKLRILNPFK